MASATMPALRFSEAAGVHMQDIAVPTPGPHEALIAVARAGICGTDLQIVAGYVPGFDHVLGHEFVGRVAACASNPSLVGQRVVGGINCNDDGFTCPDPTFQRNHAPGRTVLGIIGRDGCFAPYTVLPATNLVPVPDHVPDRQAAFAEPLAAAYRILEQAAVRAGSRVAVVGDGRLGLLVAQVLALECQVVMFGRHPDKMALLQTGSHATITSVDVGGLGDGKPGQYSGSFDAAVEVTGSDQGIKFASALVRPLGTIVQKSTCSAIPRPGPPAMTTWAELTEDLVVNEKILIGSRCGPMGKAVELLATRPEIGALCEAMIAQEAPLEEGVGAMRDAATKGCLKVQLVCS